MSELIRNSGVSVDETENTSTDNEEKTLEKQHRQNIIMLW